MTTSPSPSTLPGRNIQYTNKHTTISKDLDALYPLGDNYHILLAYHAKRTGEFRPPREGEWYLSGSTIHAYRAYAGMSQPYHICKLVKTKVTQVIRIEEISHHEP